MELTSTNVRLYDAQVAIIGSMLIDPRCVGVVLEQVSEADFSYDSYRRVFQTIHALFDAGEPIDPVTVLHRLGGGQSYEELLRQTMIVTPTACNVASYCEILKDETDLARLKDMAERVSNSGTVEEARKAMLDSLELAAGHRGWHRTELRDALNSLLDRLDDPTPPRFVRWGLPALDNNLQIKSDRGKFVILGAESSVGKTAFALQLAFSMAATGKRVGFYSLETDEESAYDRVFVQRAQIRLRDLRAKKVTDPEIRRLVDLGESLYKKPEIHLDIIDCAGATPARIRTDILIHRYDVVMIDYVQLLECDGRQRSEIVTNVSLQLHTIAMQLGVLILGLSQLTPPQEGKRNPWRLNRKEDLRESKQLINDADVIMIMSRTDEEEPNFRELLIDKNKDGPLGTIQLDFEPEFMRFVPHRPTAGESYRAVIKAAAAARKNNIPGQATLQELDEAQTGPLPEEFQNQT